MGFAYVEGTGVQTPLASEQPQPASPRRWPEVLALTAIFGIVLAVGVAFFWPWLARPAPGGAAMNRYAPLRQGGAWLVTRYDPDGALQTWESQNVVVLPGARALISDLSQETREALEALYLEEGESSVPVAVLAERVANVDIAQTRFRTMDPSGTLTSTVSTSVRDESGEYLISIRYLDAAQEVIFTPPMLALPSDLSVGRWGSEGTAGVLDYEWSRQVLESGPYESVFGPQEDCLKLQSRLVVSGQETPTETMWHEWFCAGLGYVGGEEWDGDGNPTARITVVRTDEHTAPVEALPPPVLLMEEGGQTSDPATWQFSRVGRGEFNQYNSESTISPVWLPTSPPTVLMASYEGDLLAFDAETLDGSLRWRFRTGGTIFGTPTFDAERGRLYFGSSDKRLYALDARGLFLWAFETGDNVATRPLLVDDLVIFGSEDHNVYALHAETGALRWRATTGGPVASAPALVGDLVVIGSDDGAAYAFDPQSGESRWIHVADAAIEAAIVGADGVAYVASRNGTLAAVDGASGEALWTTVIGGVGYVLRSAPAVGDAHLWIVDTSGYLTKVERATGRQVWRSLEENYIGTPVVMEDGVLVADSDGALHQLAPDGTRQTQWTTAQALSSTDGSPGWFRVNPSVGGGAVWLADNDGILRRLGPKAVEAAALSPAWFAFTTSPPFESYNLAAAPTTYGGAVLLMDSATNLYLADAATGTTAKIGDVGAEVGIPLADPVVSGDTLLVPIGYTLYAVHLPDGEPLWQVESGGLTNRPVAVTDETVLWLTEQEAEGVQTQGTLHALDLGTGEVRWEQPLEGFGFGGGAVVRDGTVYVSTPPAAFDLGTGEPRWQAARAGWAGGGPALSESGDTLFVGLYLGETLDASDEGAVVALDTATGAVRWQTSLGDDALKAFDALFVTSDTVLVPSIYGGGTVIALDAVSGAERWRHEPTATRFGSIHVADGRVWFVQENAHLIGLDAETGQVVARFSELDLNLTSLDSSFAQRPTSIGSRLYVPMIAVLLAFELPPAD